MFTSSRKFPALLGVAGTTPILVNIEIATTALVRTPQLVTTVVDGLPEVPRVVSAHLCSCADVQYSKKLNKQPCTNVGIELARHCHYFSNCFSVEKVFGNNVCHFFMLAQSSHTHTPYAYALIYAMSLCLLVGNILVLKSWFSCFDRAFQTFLI